MIAGPTRVDHDLLGVDLEPSWLGVGVDLLSGFGSVASSSLASRPSPAGGLRPALTQLRATPMHAAPEAGPGYKEQELPGNVGRGLSRGLSERLGASFQGVTSLFG
jgi:hypothetical protein